MSKTATQTNAIETLSKAAQNAIKYSSLVKSSEDTFLNRQNIFHVLVGQAFLEGADFPAIEGRKGYVQVGTRPVTANVRSVYKALCAALAAGNMLDRAYFGGFQFAELLVNNGRVTRGSENEIAVWSRRQNQAKFITALMGHGTKSTIAAFEAIKGASFDLSTLDGLKECFAAYMEVIEKNAEEKRAARKLARIKAADKREEAQQAAAAPAEAPAEASSDLTAAAVVKWLSSADNFKAAVEAKLFETISKHKTSEEMHILVSEKVA